MTWQTAWAKDRQQLKSIFAGACDLVQNGTVEIQMRNREESRRDSQNRLKHHWCKEVSLQSNNQDSPEDVRAFCKYRFGIPILIRNQEYKDKIQAVFSSLTYEQRIAVMLPPIEMPVTRLFTVKEFDEYLTNIERYYAQNGYRLTTSEDYYLQAVMRDAG